MRILGISPLDKDATVSFVEDGRIVFACAEERLSRVKQQSGFPSRALQAGLDWTGWDSGSIDAVAYAFFDGAAEARLIQEAFAEDAAIHDPTCTKQSLRCLADASLNGYRVDRSIRIPGIDDERSEFVPPKTWLKRTVYSRIAKYPLLDWFAHRREFRKWARVATADHHKWTEVLSAEIAKLGLREKLKRFRHHDAHAANAFYGSGYNEALLVSFDAYGSGSCGGVFVGNSDGIRLIHAFKFPNSLGAYYEQVTSALGYRPSRHEGKIVGLAAYGNPDHLRDVLRNRFECKQGDIRYRAGLNPYFARALGERFAKRDIAAAYQTVLEEIVQETVAYWVAETGLSHVAVSGGVLANVKLNQRIHEIEGVDSVFVYPNMGDGGLATGAALLASPRDVWQSPALPDVYLGPSYNNSEIDTALHKNNLVPECPENLAEAIARLLADQKVVARFAGRMEYGPRALGNRSILYAASDPSVNQWLNHQLGRTEFMPFAPAALASEAGRLFLRTAGCEKTAEFMTITFDCTNRMVSCCPAAVHVDDTARPQLVSEHTNKGFYDIIAAYHQITGIPAIINTSFNMHEEPIVCTPEDAIRAFLKGNIDYLAIGKYLVPHPDRESTNRSREFESCSPTASRSASA